MGYQHLLSPGNIGQMALRNRIIMSPMGSNLSEADGHCGERIQAYYEARARGGAGMVIVGVASIAWPEGACNPNQVAISSDEFLPGLSELAARVKSHNCRAAVQLQHAGKVAVRDIAAGRPMLVPSIPRHTPDEMSAALTPEELSAFVKSYTSEGARVAYQEATEEDIAALVANFADAADRALRAGFDGVEIHAGHGYILSEFLSPCSNQREDGYGGSLENRARLLQQVIRAVKARVGSQLAVWCRLDALEFRTEGGITLDDAVRTAALAEAAGADAIHVSAYANPSIGSAFTQAPLVHQPSGYLAYAAAVKKAVSIPVIAVGRLEPDVAESALAEGKADFVAMARKLLADPELPAKLGAGRADNIRPCIYCYTCVSRIFVNDHLRCAVNAQTGFEAQQVLLPAAAPRNILVVGGGPAGMETARVASLRGHRVTLVEQGLALGGTVYFSSIVYPENGALVDYLSRELARLGVDVRLNTRVDARYLAQLQPGAVVVATGARRDAPDIPGRELPHVFSGDDMRALMTGERGSQAAAGLPWWQRLLLAFAARTGISRNSAWVRRLSHLWMPVGQRVCIVGGGLVGVELAEFLAERGRKVSVVEEGEKFGVELPLVRRWRVLEDLRELGVVMINKTTLKAVQGDRVVLDCDGSEIPIEADTVILASGARGDSSLAQISREAGFETHTVGDCDGVGYIEGAVHGGHALGLQL